MFGISGQEFIVLLVLAAVVLGPERLPQYTQQLTNLVRQLRRMAQGASAQVRAEMGPEFDEIDWQKLDPRQYDPRRIVREALADTFDPDDPLGLKSGDGRFGGGATRPPRPSVAGSSVNPTAPSNPAAPSGNSAAASSDSTSPSAGLTAAEAQSGSTASEPAAPAAPNARPGRDPENLDEMT